MLQSIRDRATGFIAYAIVILISIPFALWGINEYFGGTGKLVVAEVNGTEIPVSLFSQRYQEQRRYLESAFGGRLPPQYSEDMLKRNVLDSIVRSEVLAEELRDAGYRVSDALVYDYIRDLPIFATDGRFDPERYAQVLDAQRRPKAQFEADVRNEIRRTQFETGVTTSSFVPSGAIDTYVALKNQQRDLQYLVIREDRSEVEKTIAESEIEAYYDQNSADFLTPERIKIAYIELDEVRLADQVDVEESAIVAHYEEHADQYVTPEERRVRHILVKADTESADDEAGGWERARQTIDTVASRLGAGESFEDLASELSDDSLTSDKGGDLGWLARGDLSPEVDAAVFALDVGRPGPPVRTASGWQVFEVLEVKPATQKPLDAVRDTVEQDYRQRVAESMFVDMTERLATLSYEQSDTLQPSSDALEQPVQVSDWVTRVSGSGVAASPVVREVAFADEVLQERRNSDLLEPEPGKVVVIRIAEYEPAVPRPLADVRGEIRGLLAARKSRQKEESAGSEALAQLRSQTHSMEQVAASYETELTSPGFVTRMSGDVPGEILTEAFRLKRPQDGAGPSLGGASLAAGGYAILAVNAVESGAVSAEAREAASTELSEVLGQAELQSILNAFEGAAKIRVYEENI